MQARGEHRGSNHLVCDPLEQRCVGGWRIIDSCHAVDIGTMTDRNDVPEIPTDEPLIVPLNEVSAAFAVLSRLDRLLADSSGNDIAQQLNGLGRPASNEHLPAVAGLDEAPTITDLETARTYVHGLRQRLRLRKPGGVFDPHPE